MEHVDNYESEWAALRAVSARLGMSAETLRTWVRRAEGTLGQAPGMPTELAREIHELKAKYAELEHAIEGAEGGEEFFASQCHDLGIRQGSLVLCCPGLWLVACPDVRPRRTKPVSVA
jgi:transposase